MKKLLLSLVTVVASLLTAGATTVTFNAPAQGYSNGQDVTDITIDNVNFNFSKGTNNSNSPKYYTTGTAIRVYGGNTITITAPSGGTITQIGFTFDSGEGTNAITANPGNFETDKWTGSANSVIFTIGGTSGHRRIQVIEVTYTPGEAPAVEAPKVTCENNMVSITCATDNAEIYYTIDENTPSTSSTKYSAPFAIEKNTTVKAIAYVGEDESAVTTFNATYVPSFTVAEALAAIEGGFNAMAKVKGYITQIDEIDTGSFGNATYYIADEKGGSPVLEVYRGYWMNGEKFTSEDQIEVDGLITVEGTLVNYNGTYEFTTGSKVIEYVAPEGGGDEPVDPNPPVEAKALYTLTFGAENNQSTVSNYTSTWNVISNNYEWTIENFNNNNTGLKNGNPTGDWDYARCGRKENASVAKIITDFPVEDKKHVQSIVINGTLNAANQTGLNKAYIEVYNTNPSADGATAIETVEIPGDTFIGAKGNKIDYTAELTNTNPGLYYVIVFDMNNTNANNGWLQISSVLYNGAVDSGVESVISDSDAAPVYYNLQGVKVANPEKGIYIVVKGDKTSKVIF